MIKTPFLGLIIGIIACRQGLAARGGAAAVGARTTSAVVMAIFGVIVISALFTLSPRCWESEHVAVPAAHRRRRPPDPVRPAC